MLPRYERIAFEKALVAPQGQPLAAFVCPGHPLLDAVIDLTLERHRDLLKRGTVLVDERDLGTQPRVLFYLEHAHPGRQPAPVAASAASSPSACSTSSSTPTAPRATCTTRPTSTTGRWPRASRASTPSSPGPSAPGSPASWSRRRRATRSRTWCPSTWQRSADRKLELIAKTEAAVKDRLTKEITYWDHRAEQLKLQEQAGKPNARLNSGEARKRADDLQARLQKRLEELKLEAQISPLPPVVLGGLLVVPHRPARCHDRARSPHGHCPGRHAGQRPREPAPSSWTIERGLGFEPTDRELEKLGYDIESRVPGTGKLRFIEVKGRVAGADTVTVTKNEILYSLNKPDDFILAIVEFLEDGTHRVHYLRQPFQREPDFGVTSVNYHFAELLARAEAPR